MTGGRAEGEGRLRGRGVDTTIVVPTLGRSPLLEECLRALRGEAEGGGAEIVLVEQGEGVPGAVDRLAHRHLRVPEALGFASAVNLGLAAGDGTWLAVVNDDAVVDPGWLALLVSALEAEPRAASAQGVNRCTGKPPRIDGRGLAWNRWLQAVQLGHGEAVPQSPAPAGEPREVFGVSATAAVYRREALEAVAGPSRGPAPVLGVDPPLEVFESRLETYYEDADLAARLRAAGYTALSVPAAGARHAGALTSGAGVRRWRLVYGNRYLVAARLLGRSFWGSLPRMVARDLLDLARAVGAGDPGQVGGILAGWGRAVRRLGGFARGGPPTLPRSVLAAAPELPRSLEAS